MLGLDRDRRVHKIRKNINQFGINLTSAGFAHQSCRRPRMPSAAKLLGDLPDIDLVGGCPGDQLCARVGIYQQDDRIRIQ